MVFFKPFYLSDLRYIFYVFLLFYLSWWENVIALRTVLIKHEMPILAHVLLNKLIILYLL